MTFFSRWTTNFFRIMLSQFPRSLRTTLMRGAGDRCPPIGIHVRIYSERRESRSVIDDVRDVSHKAIEAVAPHEMIKKAIRVEKGRLIVKEQTYRLDRNVHVAAFGKAVLGMIRAVDDALGDHVIRGVASVPRGSRDALLQHRLGHLIPGAESRVEIREGAKLNLPDEDCVEATRAIRSMAGNLTSDDLLLVLISGGGSALLTLPQPPLTLHDVVESTRALSARGATISELNLLRRHLSEVKGGRLALTALPARVVALVLSDVIGDPLEDIASGPTAPDSTTARNCLDFLARFRLDSEDSALGATAQKIVHFLREKERMEKTPRTAEEKMTDFSHVQNVIVGNNQMLVEAALARAEALGYRSICLSTQVDGLARERGVDAAKLALGACRFFLCHQKSVYNQTLASFAIDSMSKDVLQLTDALTEAARKLNGGSGGGLCLVFAGETTVELKGNGVGGRNQELALAAALTLHESLDFEILAKNFDVSILSVGTDGQDGPTDAAGAVVDFNTIRNCGLTLDEARSFLDNNDSYTFFSRLKNAGGLIKTGLTGTNVMDLQLIMLKPK